MDYWPLDVFWMCSHNFLTLPWRLSRLFSHDLTLPVSSPPCLSLSASLCCSSSIFSINLIKFTEVVFSSVWDSWSKADFSHLPYSSILSFSSLPSMLACLTSLCLFPFRQLPVWTSKLLHKRFLSGWQTAIFIPLPFLNVFFFFLGCRCGLSVYISSSLYVILPSVV